MAIHNSDDLIERIDNIQKTVWDVDEKVRRNLESIAWQQIEISENRNTLDFIRKDLTLLWNELRDLQKQDKSRG